VMYDALLSFSETPLSQPFPVPFVLATIHRAENTDDRTRFTAIWRGLEKVSEDMAVLFPAHPRTRNLYPDIVQSRGERLQVIEPVSYLSMLAMVRDAACIVTDSGGVQKEAYLLKTPCVTVRDRTEWPETIIAGANTLVQTDAEMISLAVKSMKETASYGEINPFGDGNAAGHIAEFIQNIC